MLYRSNRSMAVRLLHEIFGHHTIGSEELSKMSPNPAPPVLTARSVAAYGPNTNWWFSVVMLSRHAGQAAHLDDKFIRRLVLP